MAIELLPGNTVALNCDTPGCPFEGPMLHDVTEDELLDFAEARGWNIERELGLHYCPMTTMHDCDVCGAPTQCCYADLATGTVTYLCAEHWA